VATSFKGWGQSWLDSWGPITVDPNAMQGSASFSFTASLQVNSGEMQGSASFSINAIGTLGRGSQEVYSGGYAWIGRTQSKEDRRKERIRLGIEQEDIQVAVKKVAKKIATKPAPITWINERQDYVEYLVAEELRGYKFPDIAQAVARQVRILQAIEQQEEEELLMLL
jgi:hypothetical protein